MRIQGVMRWKSFKVLIALATLSFAVFKPVNAQSEPPFHFLDDFETNQGWGIFEEIVGDSACYGSDIGEVVRSTEVAFEGTYSLRVWANQALSSKSNHVIAQKKASTSGQTGRFRYQLYAFIAPETASTGETGPELSMQNTREIALNEFRTSTAGIQYRANPWSQDYKSWAIWAEAPSGEAGWQVFLRDNPLGAGEWYYIAVEADFTNNRYVRFWLRGPGVHLSLDLSSYRIAQEAKFTEQAFWLTLESENLFNNCGIAGAYHYKVYYDEIILRRLAP